ncbi:MAG: acyltransferase [Labilibaculum sp.]|nr:acyltransferase [Labilibaculum sp.]
MKQENYLNGLNSLRFIAAFFIIAMHIHNNQTIMNLPHLPNMAFLYKGAVSFFFTLSGFLITYIRIAEYEKNGNISMRNFFSKRFYRLAPVYYLVIAFGMIFYWLIVPAIGMNTHNDYNINLALFLYLIFLPNLMNSFFHVGGALNVSWSIGAQEQFYWLLIPFMKYKFKYLLKLLILISILSVLVSIGNSYNVFGLTEQGRAFVHTLRFHFMSIGALLAYMLYYKKGKLLSLWVFSRKWMQLILFLTLVAWYGFDTDSKFLKSTITLPLSLLYGWLIINIAANPKNIIKLDNKLFDWTGKRTYGIYMYHMFVLYLVSYFFSKTEFLFHNFSLYIICYYLLVFGITIGLAHFSFTYIETPIMRWTKENDEKKKLELKRTKVKVLKRA